MVESKQYVVCGVCGENLGEHRPYFAKEHLQKHPNHKEYKVISTSSKPE